MAAIRLFTDADLAKHQNVTLSKEHSHYLTNVMRRKAEDKIHLFNGMDGEWECRISLLSKRHAQVLVETQIKKQQPEPKITLCFAPVKNAPQHFLVQKATELGISVLQPLITRHTVVHRVNSDKLRANAVEAAEQCGRLTIPEVKEKLSFEQFLKQRDASSPLIFCDETGGGGVALNVLSSLREAGDPTIIIGPEGGFAPNEVIALRESKHVVSIGLGPRILRADTAALAAIAIVQATLGDWDKLPNFKML